jgi:hypothetical protein
METDIFNISSESPSVTEIATTVEKIIGGVNVSYLPARANEDSFELDGTLVTRVLGSTYTNTIADGVKEIQNYLHKETIK